VTVITFPDEGFETRIGQRFVVKRRSETVDQPEGSPSSVTVDGDGNGFSPDVPDDVERWGDAVMSSPAEDEDNAYELDVEDSDPDHPSSSRKPVQASNHSVLA
jgi:hypothetical protein